MSNSESPTRVLLLLVCYNNEQEVFDFVVEQLREEPGLDLNVMVVANAERDPATLELLSQRRPDVQVVRMANNVGYLGGAAAGLDRFLSSNKGLPDWTILMNTDVQIPAPGFFGSFIRRAEGAQVAAPAILSTLSGHQQNPFSEHRYSVRRLKFLRLVYGSYAAYFAYQTLAYLKRILFAPSRATGTTRLVYAIHGTFMAFHASYFRRGGTLKYGALLFGEELFVAEQVLSMQGACRYIPELQIEHREHASTGRYKSPRLVKYLRESTDYLIREVYRG